METFITLESEAYVARLVSDWGGDSKRTAVLQEAGLSNDRMAAGLKIAALGIWSNYCDVLMERYPRPGGRTIRRVAGLHKQAYLESKRMPLPDWSEFMRSTVIPMIGGDVAE